MQIARKMLSTREGTIAFAILSAVLAVAVLLTFINGYKRSLDQGAEPLTVLVANGPLPKGSSGDLIAKKGLFTATGLKREQVKSGAITDPATLRGMVAAHDIVKGQQLTTADFVAPTDPVLSNLGDDQRAVTIPLDAQHGMIGQIHAGDHVDVYAGFSVQPQGDSRDHPVLRVLLQDVDVLQAPEQGKGGGLSGSSSSQAQSVVLRVPEKDAPELAFSSDNGHVWIALRPQAGARQGPPTLVTLDRLLLGMDPIPVDRFLAKKRSLITKVYQGDF
jgi:Flp pilus assembly protein CpaB